MRGTTVKVDCKVRLHLASIQPTPSSLHFTLSSLHPTLSRLHPGLSRLHPTPSTTVQPYNLSTLNHAPVFFDPNPGTPNAQQLTLNPKPRTANPELSTLFIAASHITPLGAANCSSDGPAALRQHSARQHLEGCLQGTPTPYKHTSYTLKPAPYTLKPTTQTLTPTPYTLTVSYILEFHCKVRLHPTLSPYPTV